MAVNVSLCASLIGLLIFHYVVEVVLVVIPDEASNCFEELDDFPGQLDFILVFHGCLLLKLTFEAFDLEDHFGGDGTFLVEHGIGEGGFGDGAYFSWDAEGDLMDGIECVFI